MLNDIAKTFKQMQDRFPSPCEIVFGSIEGGVAIVVLFQDGMAVKREFSFEDLTFISCDKAMMHSLVKTIQAGRNQVLKRSGHPLEMLIPVQSEIATEEKKVPRADWLDELLAGYPKA